MLLCFGAAWPFSIYKAYTSKAETGQSLLFLYIIFIGYLAGIAHKLTYSYDKVIYAYILNALLVAANIILVHRNRNLATVVVDAEEI